MYVYVYEYENEYVYEYENEYENEYVWGNSYVIDRILVHEHVHEHEQLGHALSFTASRPSIRVVGQHA